MPLVQPLLKKNTVLTQPPHEGQPLNLFCGFCPHRGPGGIIESESIAGSAQPVGSTENQNQ
jgi:hypothetical protein